MKDKTTNPRNYKIMAVSVEIYDDETEEFLKGYVTNLANDTQRRVFAEQMTNTYAGGQYSVVSPVKVIEK